MSGHSKWNNIKNRKAAVDAKKSKVFAIISKLITVAVKEGGSGDADSNPRLRLALDKAKAANMPNANIQKAVDKGMGKGGGAMIEEILYEGFGPGGVGIMVRALTDNRNRTGSEIKYIFDRNGGSLGGPNSVSYMFERDGDSYQIKVPVPVEDSVKSQVDNLVELLDEQDDVELVITNVA
jgi:YebC/PmpR family DNA-binding regulatory protein